MFATWLAEAPGERVKWDKLPSLYTQQLLTVWCWGKRRRRGVSELKIAVCPIRENQKH